MKFLPLAYFTIYNWLNSVNLRCYTSSFPLPFILIIAIRLLTVYFIHFHSTLVSPLHCCDHVFSVAWIAPISLQLFPVLQIQFKCHIHRTFWNITRNNFFMIPIALRICYHKDHIYVYFYHVYTHFNSKTFFS